MKVIVQFQNSNIIIQKQYNITKHLTNRQRKTTTIITKNYLLLGLRVGI